MDRGRGGRTRETTSWAVAAGPRLGVPTVLIAKVTFWCLAKLGASPERFGEYVQAIMGQLAFKTANYPA